MRPCCWGGSLIALALKVVSVVLALIVGEFAKVGVRLHRYGAMSFVDVGVMCAIVPVVGFPWLSSRIIPGVPIGL